MALLRTCRNSSLVSSAFCSAMATVWTSSSWPDRNRCAASVAFRVACSTEPTLAVTRSGNEDGAALPGGLTEGNGARAGKPGLRIGRIVVDMSLPEDIERPLDHVLYRRNGRNIGLVVSRGRHEVDHVFRRIDARESHVAIAIRIGMTWQIAHQRVA